MYRGDEKIAVVNDPDLGDAPITFDERVIDALRDIGEGFLAIDPRLGPDHRQRAEAARRARCFEGFSS
jgi:hypothetical protein